MSRWNGGDGGRHRRRSRPSGRAVHAPCAPLQRPSCCARLSRARDGGARGLPGSWAGLPAKAAEEQAGGSGGRA
eukprot:9146292-Pyramimonas_sp.AAC.1